MQAGPLYYLAVRLLDDLGGDWDLWGPYDSREKALEDVINVMEAEWKVLELVDSGESRPDSW